MSEGHIENSDVSKAMPKDVSRLIIYFEWFSYLAIYKAITDSLDVLAGNIEGLGSSWADFINYVNALGFGENLAEKFLLVLSSTTSGGLFLLLFLIIFSSRRANSCLTHVYWSQGFKIEYNIIGHFKGQWNFSNSIVSHYLDFGFSSFRRTILTLSVLLLVFGTLVSSYFAEFHNLKYSKNIFWAVIISAYFPIAWNWSVIDNLSRFDYDDDYQVVSKAANIADIVITIAIVFAALYCCGGLS